MRVSRTLYQIRWYAEENNKVVEKRFETFRKDEFLAKFVELRTARSTLYLYWENKRYSGYLNWSRLDDRHTFEQCYKAISEMKLGKLKW